MSWTSAEITGSVAIGYFSLRYNQKSNNTAVGNEAARENRGGSWLTAVGSYALKLNTSGSYNTAIGAQSMESNISGQSNTGMGFGALHDNTTGAWNTAGERRQCGATRLVSAM